MPILTKPIRRELILLGLILLIAIVARLPGIGFGLPYVYHPDEPRYLISAQILFKTRSLDPQSIPYISSSALVYVINALAYIPYYLIGKLVGHFHSTADVLAPELIGMGVGRTLLPSTFILGRLVTLIFGTGSVGLVFLIGKKWHNSAFVGLIAALFMAVSPTNSSHSQLITPDAFVVFFALLTFYAAVQIDRKDRLVHYLLCGFAVGAIVSAKISGGIIILPIILIVFLRQGFEALRNPKLYGLLVSAILGLILTTPYLLVNPTYVIQGILFEGQHYSSGHAGMEGNTFLWYVTYLGTTSGLIFLVGLFEIIRAGLPPQWLRNRQVSNRREILLLSVFPLVYFGFVCTFVVRNDRTILPVTPFLFLLSASFLSFSIQEARCIRDQQLRRAAQGAIAAFTLLALWAPITQTYAYERKLLMKDGRDTARVWIANNVPAGAKIAYESYSPFIEPKIYSIENLSSLIEHTPQWYQENHFEYLVFSQGMYGRFFADSNRYADQVGKYNQLFKSFQQVQRFTDNDYEILIYKVNP